MSIQSRQMIDEKHRELTSRIKEAKAARTPEEAVVELADAMIDMLDWFACHTHDLEESTEMGTRTVGSTGGVSL